MAKTKNFTRTKSHKRKAEQAFYPGSNAENESKKTRTNDDEDDDVPMYDVIRQRNIETRERLFNELKIGETVAELRNSFPTPKPSNRVKKSADAKSLTPERKSLRLQKIDADTGLQLPDKEPAIYSVRSVEERPRLPLEDLFVKDVAEWRSAEDLDELVEEKTKYLKMLTDSQEFDSNQKSSFEGDVKGSLGKLQINVSLKFKI